MSNAAKQLAREMGAFGTDALEKALDAFAEHIASRVMAHLRGEAGLNVDQAINQFTGNLEEDLKAAQLRDSLSEME